MQIQMRFQSFGGANSFQQLIFWLLRVLKDLRCVSNNSINIHIQNVHNTPKNTLFIVCLICLLRNVVKFSSAFRQKCTRLVVKYLHDKLN